MSLKIGDVVRHKSGGPLMVVEYVSLFGGHVHTKWWDQDTQSFYEQRFPAAVVRRV